MKIIGVEFLGVSSMYEFVVVNNQVVILFNIDKFVDGVFVVRVGDIIFEIVKENVDDYV